MQLKKNPKSDLERIKSTLVVLGLVSALSLILMATEWKTFDYLVSELGDYDDGSLEEEEIPISVLQNQPPPPPPPAPTTIEIVDDEEEVEEEIEFDMEIDEETVIEDFQEEEEIVEDEIFTIVEQMPAFPGGESALFKYLQKNVKYPPMAKDAGISGRVFVKFVIGKNGKVGDVQVLRGIGGGCDKEAVRVVKAMPSWTPGQQRGRPVSVYFNLPINFILK